MRSSKSRSRNKNNRNNNRPSGNIVNRVFDSSGPEGKVRGTPQQIIDKYNQLARDAQLANDRVATENFQQHAEHYMRLLSEAMREQEARREEQERQNRERQAERDRERQERAERQERESNSRPAAEVPSAPAAPVGNDLSEAPQPDVVDIVSDGDSGLVETPETQPKPKPARKPRRKPAPRKPAAETAPADVAPEPAPKPENPEAAE
ncbi:DUF4167 domain-containing protein [Shimia litoralis]|uniref:DUF4167 domain-containing protein n=1 Tax=Shimia litoralis TaxID=420403 RepID=A0A4U7N4M4_9RHOB|nr:DUF4167 domain-containing protein [Shimia litoralis]TKZ20725.1 DUF4167 domain-containing protein [Shimia litoralis]